MADAKGLKIDIMRSYLGRARGLGAATCGASITGGCSA